MNFRETNKNNTLYYLFLIISIFSYFIGFFLNENSAGGGSYIGDLKLIWSNLQIFLNNSLHESLVNENYVAGRTPIASILHKYLNPFTNDLDKFRLSVFCISLFLPILFFISVNLKYKNDISGIALFVTSILFLSPYFRTSAYWGLEENYGLIFLLLTYIFFLKINNYTSVNFLSFGNTFAICLFSSLTFYFDQKLLVVPLICLIYLLSFSNQNVKKFFAIFLYFLFALPYLYLMSIWGSVIPSTAANRAFTLEIVNIGYTVSIMAFYIAPFLISKKIPLRNILNNLKSKVNHVILIFIFIYCVSFYFLYDQSIKWVSGNGVFYKFAILFFQDLLFQKIFLIFTIFVSSLILILFFDKKHDRFILLFFLILSLIVTPVYQEYFDPLMLLIIFTFAAKRIELNFQKSLFIYIYFATFLIFSNIYYYNLLNKFY